MSACGQRVGFRGRRERSSQMMTIPTLDGAEARIARLEAQNQRLIRLAEALVTMLVDHGVINEWEREQLPIR